MLIVDADRPTRLQELLRMAEAMFGDMVKTVVDIEKSIMVLDAELHSDE